ncbi:MAG: TetR/AcrR family transcriptional regulator [Firmicutes bacterium]|nr:TetR/AcrR family transcriptional regulator [Bacillota bacterium]
MLKPLTQEQIERIIETAIRHFADRGFAGANINKIATESGVSVGVLYKYYQDKTGLFTVCVQQSLDYLDAVFRETQAAGGTLMEMIENLIRRSQQAAREHPEYFRLYHQITVSGAPVLRMEAEHVDGSGSVAELIEGRSAGLYRQLLQEAKDSGEVRGDLDPAAFAFFFDNLMMMLHFAYACDYYQERFRLYCGEDAADEKKDEEVRGQLMRFIEGAFRGENR